MFPLERPAGVSILSVLQFIGGVLLILFGALVLAAGDLVGGILGDSAATLYYILGVVLAGVGIISLFIAYGLWLGRGWAWIVTIVLAVIGLSGSLIESTLGLAVGGSATFVVTLLPNSIILLYLSRASVRAFFGIGRPYTHLAFSTYPQEPATHLADYPESAISLNTFESSYSQEVLEDLANNQIESTKVLAAFHQSGQSGVAEYLRKEDPDLTISEASSIAFAIIVDIDSIVSRAGNATTIGIRLNGLDEAKITAAGSQKTDREREPERERSWIERWLQR